MTTSPRKAIKIGKPMPGNTPNIELSRMVLGISLKSMMITVTGSVIILTTAILNILVAQPQAIRPMNPQRIPTIMQLQTPSKSSMRKSFQNTNDI